MVEHVPNGGIHEAFVMTPPGVFSRLGPSQWEAAVRAVVEVVEGRVPVFAGISASGTRLVREEAGRARSIGADVHVARPNSPFSPATRRRTWACR